MRNFLFPLLLAMLSTLTFSQGDKPMIDLIESGIVARLNDKVLAPAQEIGIGKSIKTSLATPSVNVYVEQGTITAINANKTVFRNDIAIDVVIQFDSLRDEEDIRQGAYPIILSALSFLSGQTLDLDMSPLVPKGFTNVTDPDGYAKGVMTWHLVFTSAYYFNKLEDEDAAALLRAGVSYLLEPRTDANNNPDMSASVS